MRRAEQVPCAGQSVPRRRDLSELDKMLLEGLGQALAHLDGEVVPGTRVRTIGTIPDETGAANQRALRLRLWSGIMCLPAPARPTSWRERHVVAQTK